ncbi:hypothetical protein BHM03_00054070, partial [Ensete ventricosum]
SLYSLAHFGRWRSVEGLIDHRRSIEGEIDCRRSIEGEKGKKKKQKKEDGKKKELPRAVLARKRFFSRARRKIEATPASMPSTSEGLMSVASNAAIDASPAECSVLAVVMFVMMRKDNSIGGEECNHGLREDMGSN